MFFKDVLKKELLDHLPVTQDSTLGCSLSKLFHCHKRNYIIILSAVIAELWTMRMASLPIACSEVM